MKKILIATLIAFAMVGCLDVSTDGSVDNSIDNSVDNSITDSNITYAHEGTDPVDNVTPDIDTYDEGLSQEECNDLGFYFCTIEQQCIMDSTSSCPL